MSNEKSSIAAALDRMTDRERKLVFLTAGVGVFVVGGLFVSLSQGALDSKAKRVQAKQEQLAAIEALEERYKEAEADEKRALTRLQSNTTSLFSHLQKTAGSLGLTLSDLAERQLPVKDSAITEITVDVNLKALSVDKLTQFLEAIEGNDKSGLVKITKLKVKTTHVAEDLLDVTVTVSTWKKT